MCLVRNESLGWRLSKDPQREGMAASELKHASYESVRERILLPTGCTVMVRVEVATDSSLFSREVGESTL